MADFKQGLTVGTRHFRYIFGKDIPLPGHVRRDLRQSLKLFYEGMWALSPGHKVQRRDPPGTFCLTRQEWLKLVMFFIDEYIVARSSDPRGDLRQVLGMVLQHVFTKFVIFESKLDTEWVGRQKKLGQFVRHRAADPEKLDPRVDSVVLAPKLSHEFRDVSSSYYYPNPGLKFNLIALDSDPRPPHLVSSVLHTSADYIVSSVENFRAFFVSTRLIMPGHFSTPAVRIPLSLPRLTRRYALRAFGNVFFNQTSPLCHNPKDPVTGQELIRFPIQVIQHIWIVLLARE